MRLLACVALLLGTAATRATAQGVGFQFGYLWTDPPGVSYRLGYSSRLWGPVGAELHGVHINSSGALGNLWGGGADLSLFRSGSSGLYLVGGVEGGYNAAGSETFRGSWSAGLGYEFFPLSGASLSFEGRYRVVGPGSYDGVELGVRLGLDRGSRRSSGGSGATGSAATSAPPTRESVEASLATAGASAGSASRISNVVQTALDVMGTPYRWGGEGDGGFDCSGLIQYAYAENGVTLPRRSADQARQGTSVARNVESLRPGDILTFANDGTRVSHVGLYVGNRKFIHSASGGVQLSLLSDEDVSGRWWFRRWVGARRILD
ncbi:MAG: C40 family peptidase [Gemmatimonadota bacterium]|nr:C40 family peptidase [Gemmatimonadota bacterium]MDH5282458.1 C40 family peptidase [Gemmatimonadota bacterium]